MACEVDNGAEELKDEAKFWGPREVDNGAEELKDEANFMPSQHHLGCEVIPATFEWHCQSGTIMKEIPLLFPYLILLHEFLCHSSYTGETVMLILKLGGLVYRTWITDK